MLRNTADIASSEITSKSVYLRRRKFIGGALIASAGMALPAAAAPIQQLRSLNHKPVVQELATGFYTAESKTPYVDIKRYNNFYEFGTGKGHPAKYADSLTVDPWSLAVEGGGSTPWGLPA